MQLFIENHENLVMKCDRMQSMTLQFNLECCEKVFALLEISSGFECRHSETVQIIKLIIISNLVNQSNYRKPFLNYLNQGKKISKPTRSLENDNGPPC